MRGWVIPEATVTQGPGIYISHGSLNRPRALGSSQRQEGPSLECGWCSPESRPLRLLSLCPPGAAGHLVFWHRAEEVLGVVGCLSEEVVLLGLGRRPCVCV